MVLESLLGESLLKSDGTEIKTEELTSEKGAVVGLYFSAHWCGPCRSFTPELSAIYDEIKSAGHNFEIVFISSDSDEESFRRYHGEMPWLAIPFNNNQKKDACSEKFEVEGIPSLVLLDAETGDTIHSDGRDAIDSYGVAAFPFTEEKLSECEKEKEENKARALKDMTSLSFLAPLTTIEHNETEIDLQTVTRTCEALAFAFVKGRDCQGSSIVLPKLIDIQESLGKSKLNIILVPLEDMEEFDDTLKSKMKDIPMIEYGERSTEIVKKFEAILSDIEAPHIFVADTTDESSLKVYAENAAIDIYCIGAAGFPWSSKALDAITAKLETIKEEVRLKQKNLEFFASNDQCHVVDKEGVAVPLSILQSKDVVGIYFSAHWCGPCRGFTPQLVKLYNNCKEHGKSFEVVFVSSDEDQTEFENYYADMPWCALSFSERNLKTALSEVFDVQGIPTLVLLSGDGETITEEGREAVMYGIDYFPWNKEEMARGKVAGEETARQALEKVKESEKEVIREQEKANKIVIRRHIGNPADVKISADHIIDFANFSTVAAPSAVVPSGKKAWYEVTFKGGTGVSQVGWATSEFMTSDEFECDGVGDCENSYGFDGQRGRKWHSGECAWGKEFTPDGDRVLGVAVDLENGRLLFGLDGDWSEPMGTAFDDIDKGIDLYPALTGDDVKLSVNFGGSDFIYGPPDSSFRKLKDVLES